jgi:hypothetical protein
VVFGEQISTHAYSFGRLRVGPAVSDDEFYFHR